MTIRSRHGRASALAAAAALACLALALPGTAFAQPTGLAAVSSPGDALLTWSDAATDTVRYGVYRSSGSGGPYSRIATSYPCYFRDSTGATGSVYHYVVTSVVASGTESGYSVEASGSADVFASDAFEPDDASATARPITADGTPQAHNFDSVLDEDWVMFSATAGEYFEIKTDKLGVDADTVLYLYGPDVVLPLAVDDDSGGPNYASRIVWQAPADGTYYIKVADVFGASGRGTNYELSVLSSSLDGQDPTVISLSPADGGKISSEVILSAVARDNVSVADVTFQCSTDSGATWTDLGTVYGTAPTQERFDLGWWPADAPASLADASSVEVRAVARDPVGNVSDGTPVAAYATDFTPPAPPASLDWSSGVDTITVDWSPSPSPDVDHYNVYRSTVPVGGAVRARTTGLSFTDFVDPGRLWYFRVSAVDGAGNESTAQVVANDTTPPVVTGFIPPNGSKLCAVSAIGVECDDNSGLKSATFAYSTDGGVTWNAIGDSDPGDAYVDLDTFSLSEGQIQVKAAVTDYGDNSVESAPVRYTIDNSIPAAPFGLVATAANGGVDLSWEGAKAVDFDCYYIFRSTDPGGPYAYLGDASEERYFDGGEDTATYYYVVRQVDDVGNQSGDSNEADAGAGTFGPDAFEEDDTAVAAGAIVVEDAAQRHNFDVAYDEDWALFTVDTTCPLVFSARPLVESGVAYLEVRADDGETVLAGEWQRLGWTPSSVGTYYLKVSDSDGSAGYATTYDLSIAHGSAPTVLALSPEDGSLVADTQEVGAQLEGTAGVASVVFQCSTDTVTWAPIGPATDDGLDGWRYADWDTTSLEGTYKVRAIVQDVWGHTSDGTPVYTYVVDNTPPEPPVLTSVDPSGDNALRVWWDPSPSAYGYVVERTTDATSGSWAEVGSVSTTSFVDAGLLFGTTYYYRVVSTDLPSRQSSPSNYLSGTPSDSTSPTVTDITPPNSQIVADGCFLEATMNEGVTGVLFQYSADEGATWIDIPGSTGADRVWQVWWDVTGLSEGIYDVRAIATDPAGHSSDGRPLRTYNVDNTPPPVNDAPVAVNDAYTVAEDATLTLTAPGPLANDSDPDSETIQFVRYSDPHNSAGCITNLDGSGYYKPNAGFNGVDHLTYRAFDGQEYSNIATVTITVTPVNDVPVAVNHSYEATEDVELVVAAPGLLQGCTAADTSTPRAYVYSAPTTGVLESWIDGTIHYTPAANDTGTVTFTYRVHDGDQYSAPATVTIGLAPVQDPPVAVNDSYTIVVDTTLTLTAPGPLGNDRDPDGDPILFYRYSDPHNSAGCITNLDGSGYYKPNAGFNGIDHLTYRAFDGQEYSNIATVTITVTPVNNVPVAVNHSYEATEDVELVVAAPGLLEGCTAADTSTPRAYVYSAPTTGVLESWIDGTIHYTPAANDTGTVTFTYRVHDGDQYSAPATVTIGLAPVQDPPVAVNDSYTVAEDATLTLTAPGPLANDSDPDSETIQFVRYSDPHNSAGCITNLDGSGYYKPNAGFNGVDHLTYRAFDGQEYSNVATVTITVTPAVPTSREVTRVSGADRYVVAAEMAKKGWNADGTWGETSHVVVACGEAGKEADPLAAAGLAGVYDAPILLVRNSSTLPNSTRNVINAIGSANASISVHIVGGTASVPAGAATALDRLTNVNHVTRVAGADRYAVTANIVSRMRNVVGTDGIPGVLIICSEKSAAFYDALAASPAAYRAHMPMLGVRASGVPSSVRAVLNTTLVSKPRYLVSGTTYLSNTVLTTCDVQGPATRVVTSSNRYTAASQIASAALENSEWELGASDVGIASKISDSLGGGAFMGKRGGLMLYTGTTGGLQAPTRDWITAHRTSIVDGWVFGGAVSVPEAQLTQFQAILDTP